MIRFLIKFGVGCGLLASVGWAQESTTRADAQLQDLVALQQELLAQAAEAEVQEDVEQLRPRLQDLVFDWEAYLRTYPEKPEGFIAYSMLLGNPLIDERERAKALLLKANALDPNLPIVKNQLGKYLAEEGRPLEALPYFLAAVELEPNEPLYHYQVGQLLGGARSDFITSGEWTVEAIDKAMQHAFSEAVRLKPDSLPYAYRYAESYYDVENPPWDEALAAWQALEERAESPVERKMMRLHQANVMLFQGDLDGAEALLAEEEFSGVLAGQKDRLLARLERLRNPPPIVPSDVGETVVAESAAGPAEAPPTTMRLPPPPLVVPEFRPVVFGDPVAIESAVVVEYGDVEAEEAGLKPPELSGTEMTPIAPEESVEAESAE